MSDQREYDVELAVLGTKVDGIETSLLKVEKSIQSTVNEVKEHLDEHIDSIHRRLDREHEQFSQYNEMKMVSELEKLRNELHVNVENRLEDLDQRNINRFREIKNEFRLWVGSLITTVGLVAGFMTWQYNQPVIDEQDIIVIEMQAILQEHSKLLEGITNKDESK